MSNTKVIDKVRKLLALSASANEFEAALAASHAHRLLAEHNLTMTDLEVKEAGASEDTLDLGTKAADKWARVLCTVVATSFDCRTIIRTGGGNTAKIAFVGVCEDPTIALYTSQYLIFTLKRLAKDFVKTLPPTLSTQHKAGNKKSYLLGAVRGVQHQLREAKIQAPVTTMALVPVKGHLIKAFIADTYTNARQMRSRTTSVLSDAYERGKRDGRDLQIKRGVGASRQALAIGR